MSYRKHIKRARFIGALMIASELMLLALAVTWFKSQYRETEKQLDADIRNIFNRTQSKITDSLLDNAVMKILKSVPTKHALPTFNRTQMAGKELLISGRRPGKPLKPGELIIARNPAEITPRDIRDSALPEDLVKKAMRITLLKLNDENSSEGTLIIIDSRLLKTEFSAALKRAYPRINITWKENTGSSDKPFQYHATNSGTAAELNGYGYYILHRTWPQFAFAVVLVVLTIAAFVLAYRTIKRQRAFSIHKDSFINNVSHELKTPVAATQVALEAMKTYGALHDPLRSEKYLNIAVWEMNRLRTLIDRVIDNLQATDGRLVAEKKPTDIHLLLCDVVQMLQPVFTEKQVNIHWDVTNATFIADADTVHLTNAMYNLLDNAAKYGGTQIEITIRDTNNAIVLTISDNGTGIAKEHQHKIFDQFYRVPQGDVHNIKGHGLGLSYTHHVVQMHGGQIKLESVKGKGSRFIISIPKKATNEL